MYPQFVDSSLSHLIFFFSLLTGTLGFSVVMIAILLWRKIGDILIGQYTILLCILALIFGSEFLEAYVYISGASFFLQNRIINNLFYLVSGLSIILYYPWFILRIQHRKISINTIILITAPGLLFLTGPLSSLFGRGNPVLHESGDIILFLVLLSWTLNYRRNIKDVPSGKLRRVSKILIIASLLVLPSFFTDFVFSRETNGTILEHISLSFLFFYLVWNIVNLIFAGNIFFKNRAKKNPLGISEGFTLDFGLTPRETEITALLVLGKSNKGIAYKLNISERTVKNHIYAVFRKTGVQSRVELILKTGTYPDQ